MPSPCLQGAEEGIGSSGTKVADGCERLCGCWEPKPNPLSQLQVHLTSEPVLQPLPFH